MRYTLMQLCGEVIAVDLRLEPFQLIHLLRLWSHIHMCTYIQLLIHGIILYILSKLLYTNHTLHIQINNTNTHKLINQ